MGVVDRERHPWRFSFIRYQTDWLGVVFCRNVVNYSNSGKAKSKVDRECQLFMTNHVLLAAIQATQDKISGSVKLQMLSLWIGAKS